MNIHASLSRYVFHHVNVIVYARARDESDNETGQTDRITDHEALGCLMLFLNAYLVAVAVAVIVLWLDVVEGVD